VAEPDSKFNIFFNELTNSSFENCYKNLIVIDKNLTDFRDFLVELKKCKPFHNDAHEASIVQISLNTSVLIAYGRIFKNNRGFKHHRDICKLLKTNFSEKESMLHKKVLDLRDQAIAHSDFDFHKVEIHRDDIFEHSIIRMEPLELAELEMLLHMFVKLNKYVEEFLEYCIQKKAAPQN
jgi:hypothetical protein